MENTYALLPDRVKAAIIDSIVLIAGMYAVSELLSLFEDVPNYVRIIAAVLLFVLYDPLFTSIYGGTIGHSYSNICVKKDADRSKNISFPMAIIRFILKACLGWMSLVTVTGNKKRKAIHDFVAQSVVIST